MESLGHIAHAHAAKDARQQKKDAKAKKQFLQQASKLMQEC